jgi:hypothetical protein
VPTRAASWPRCHAAQVETLETFECADFALQQFVHRQVVGIAELLQLAIGNAQRLARLARVARIGEAMLGDDQQIFSFGNQPGAAAPADIVVQCLHATFERVLRLTQCAELLVHLGGQRL